MHEPVADATRFSIAESVVAQPVGDESVLLDLDSGTYFSLNTVGRCVWETAQAGGSVRDIVARLTEQYEVTPEEARADALALLQEAVEHGLLVAR